MKRSNVVGGGFGLNGDIGSSRLECDKLEVKYTARRHPADRIVSCLATLGLCVASPSAAIAQEQQEVTTAKQVEQSAPESPAAPQLRLSEFFQRVGGNFLALGDTQNLPPLLFAVAGIGGAVLLDDEVHLAFPADDPHHGTPTGRFSTGRILPKLGDLGNVLGNSAVMASSFAGLLIVGNLQGKNHLYSTAQSLLQGLIVSEVVVQSTKRIVRRERPNLSNRRSFPSGHSASFFTAATIAGNRYGKKIGIPIAIFATGVAASRIEKHAHWFSDMVAGAGVGFIVGRSVTRSNRRFNQRQSAVWTPIVGPGRVGLARSW